MASFNEAFERLETRLANISERIEKQLVLSHSGAVNAANRAQLGMLFGCILAVLVVCFSAWRITLSIQRPLARGLATLTGSAKDVLDESGKIAGASDKLAGSVTEQAAALEEVASAVEEISSVTSTTASSAGSAAQLMREVEARVEQAVESLGRMSDSIVAIEQSSKKMSTVMRVVQEIAFQTNILALNAAVEAARAGEAGSGFAIVADEVRRLAQRCASAAEQTAELIHNNIDNAEQGVGRAHNVRSSITEMSASAARVKELVESVSMANREQAGSVDQIVQSITHLSGSTQATAVSAETSSLAAKQLTQQADMLHQVVRELSTLTVAA